MVKKNSAPVSLHDSVWSMQHTVHVFFSFFYSWVCSFYIVLIMYMHIARRRSTVGQLCTLASRENSSFVVLHTFKVFFKSAFCLSHIVPHSYNAPDSCMQMDCYVNKAMLSFWTDSNFPCQGVGMLKEAICHPVLMIHNFTRQNRLKRKLLPLDHWDMNFWDIKNSNNVNQTKNHEHKIRSKPWIL